MQVIPGLVALALAAATTATTPSSTPAEAPPLMEAEAALRAGIHGKCIELARDAVKSGRLDQAALARAWLVRGRCHVLDGDAEKAERAYAVAVRVDPDVILPTDDAIFARVKPEGRAPATRLHLEARAVVLPAATAPTAAVPGAVVGAVVGIDVLLQDDLGLAAGVVLIDDDDREVAAAPVAGPTATLAPVHRLSGFPVEGLRARLLDKAGNRLRIVDVTIGDDVRRALGVAGATPSPSPARPEVGTLAWVGAGILGTGFALATVMGIQTAVALQADETRVVDDELPVVLGFAAGVVAFATGGALIVADRLHAPTTATTAATTTTTATTETTTIEPSAIAPPVTPPAATASTVPATATTPPAAGSAP